MAVTSSPPAPEKTREETSPKKPVPPVEPPHGDTSETSYYAKVASRYRTAKYLTVFLLVLLLLGGLVMGSGNITYANFVYLLRDLDVVFDAVGGTDADSLREIRQCRCTCKGHQVQGWNEVRHVCQRLIHLW